MGIILLLIGVLATTSNHMVHVGSKASMIKEVKAENGSGGPESSATPKYKSDGEKHDAMFAFSPLSPKYSSSSMESEAYEPRLGKASKNDIASIIRSWTMENKANPPKEIVDVDYTQQPEVSAAESPSLSTSDSFSERDRLSLSEDSEGDKTVLFHTHLDQSMSQTEANYEKNIPWCAFCQNHFGKNRINFLVEGELTKEEEEFNAFRRIIRPKLKEKNSEVEDPNASAKDNESQFMSLKDNKNEESSLIADDHELDTLSKNSDETESVVEEFLDIPKTLMTILRNLEELERISLCESKRPYQLCSHVCASCISRQPRNEKQLSKFCALELDQCLRLANTPSKEETGLENIISDILQYSTLHLETVKKAYEIHNEFDKLKSSFLSHMQLLLEPYEIKEPDAVCTTNNLHLFMTVILAQWSSWQNFIMKEERDRILSKSDNFATYIYSLLNVYTTAFLEKMSDEKNNSALYYNRVERAYCTLSDLIRNFFVIVELNLQLTEERGSLRMIHEKVQDYRLVMAFGSE